MHRYARKISLVLAFTTAAHAAPPDEMLARDAAPPGIEQVLYKGVAGNLLEAVPIDPEARVSLQRANAVISNSLSARSLALALGMANPLFLVGGLMWGLWAAANISDPPPDTRWLGPGDGPAIGFCKRSHGASCQLHAGYGSQTAFDSSRTRGFDHAESTVTATLPAHRRFISREASSPSEIVAE